VNARAWLVPAALVALLLVALVALDPARLLPTAAPPAEDVFFERVELEPGRIVLHVRNAGAADVEIAQVIVDDAYWEFEQSPAGPLSRLARATITLEYPWVETEPVTIAALTASGIRFAHTIDVPIETPRADAEHVGKYALIGLLVGVLPIVAGMALLPAMREAAARWTDALLAFTLGLLAFLLVDTVLEGFELADELPGALHGTTLFAGAALAAVVAVLALEAVLKKRGAGAWTLAILIAVGIGLHNLGEGLVVGSAFALGSLALGSALVIGFALHNVTEGPAIVSPLAKGERLGPARFVALAALAGLPTVAGAWLGAFAGGGVLPVVFFGLGAGAILVVLIQVGAAMKRDGARLASARNLVAFAIGYALMLATSYLVAA
jgi:zinc transporter, ZIP family